MKEMGWSYTDLCESPTDLVEAVIEHMVARDYWGDKKKQLDGSK